MTLFAPSSVETGAVVDETLNYLAGLSNSNLNDPQFQQFTTWQSLLLSCSNLQVFNFCYLMDALILQAEEKHCEILGKLLYTAKLVAKQEGLDDGFRVVINDGPSGC